MAKKDKKGKKEEIVEEVVEEVVEEELVEEEAPVEEPVLEVQENEPPRCFWKQHEKPNKYFRVDGKEYPEADVEEVEHPIYKLKDGTEFTIVN